MNLSEVQPEQMEGIEITKLEPKTAPLITEQQRRVLEVYDRLEELQLEIAFLKAKGVLSKEEPAEATEADIKTAENELLKAKAVYQVRTNNVENVLIAYPILRAIHAGNKASSIEQDLRPLTQERYALSVSLTQLSSKVLSAQNELTRFESEHVVTARKNAELATQMCALAEEANSRKMGAIDDPKLRIPLVELEASAKISRQRWRILKDTVSATIVGSGVDWARDPKLVEIVMDGDQDDDDDEG